MGVVKAKVNASSGSNQSKFLLILTATTKSTSNTNVLVNKSFIALAFIVSAGRPDIIFISSFFFQFKLIAM